MPENLKKDPEIDKQEGPNGMTPLADVRPVQLNEKTDQDKYQILHPETDSNQVITNPDRQFVSQTEKDHWNHGYNLGDAALHYRGLWEEHKQYYHGDVVAVYETIDSAHPDRFPGIETGIKYFIYDNRKAIHESINKYTPRCPKYDSFIDLVSSGGNVERWISINIESYLAKYTEKIKVTRSTQGTFTFGLIKSGNNQYEDIVTNGEFLINPATKTITVGSGETAIILNGNTGTVTAKEFKGHLTGDVTGKADSAEVANKYVAYNRNEDGSIGAPTGQTPVIDQAIYDLDKRIDDLTSGTGGAVLSHGIDIKKNGKTLLQNGPFTGAHAEENVNITFSTAEISDLLNESKEKIQEKWLPDSLFGQLNYIGTFNASTGKLNPDLRPEVSTGVKRVFAKGDYAIVNTAGLLDPEGKAHHDPDSPDVAYYNVGDWAVYNGDTNNNSAIDPSDWTKVDNTDAVTMVNSQIGAVETYKSTWTPKTIYYKGDLVKNGDAVYVCIETTDAKQENFPEAKFQILGKVYDASDGIKLDGNTFKHDFNTATTETATIGDALVAGGTVVIPTVELKDIFGHVKKVTNNTYTLPADTWRPIKVSGEPKLDSSTGENKFVDFITSNDEDYEAPSNKLNIKFVAEGNKVQLTHAAAKGGKGSHTSTITSAVENQLLLGSTVDLPTFSWGSTGHIESYSNVTATLPEDLIKHNHFKVEVTDGKATIRSYTADEYKGQSKVFYDGAVLPTDTAGMNFNGTLNAFQFKQVSVVAGKKDTLQRVIDESASIISGKQYDDITDIKGNFINAEGKYQFELGNSGVNPGVWSAIAVNAQGIATAGGQILEFGDKINGDPSDALVIGGLFFRKREKNYKVTDVK